MMKLTNILSELLHKDYTPNEKSVEYVGPTFLFSSKKIKFEDLPSSIITKFINKAQTNDDDSNYIYEIKTKYPLINKILFWNHNLFDDEVKLKTKTKQYSGTYNKDFFGLGEIKATIKKSDITNFKLVGGLSIYDKDLPKIGIRNLSEKTRSYLYSYMSGRIIHAPLTKEIEQELKWTVPKHPLKLFKGIEAVQLLHQSDKKPPYFKGQKIRLYFDYETSWTSNPLVGRAFVEDDASTIPFLIEAIVKPDLILTDTRMIKDKKEFYGADQREIICKKGYFDTKIVWAGE